jgi:hypothetical protein
MHDRIILDLCGGTGSWSDPYRKAGYQVHVITLPDLDITKARILPDGLIEFPYEHPLKTVPFLVNPKTVVGILAAPPCTMFSRARTTAKTPRDFDGAMEVVKACLEIIWHCRAHGNLKWWALENPMGLLRQFLGNPAYSFRGWEFGDAHMKFTDLWGYFSPPRKKRGAKAPKSFDRRKWALAKKPDRFADRQLSRADVRAITPSKFAAAFCKANP